jgi:hypothetical protein
MMEWNGKKMFDLSTIHFNFIIKWCFFVGKFAGMFWFGPGREFGVKASGKLWESSDNSEI